MAQNDTDWTAAEVAERRRLRKHVQDLRQALWLAMEALDWWDVRHPTSGWLDPWDEREA